MKHILFFFFGWQQFSATRKWVEGNVALVLGSSQYTHPTISIIRKLVEMSILSPTQACLIRNSGGRAQNSMF